MKTFLAVLFTIISFPLVAQPKVSPSDIDSVVSRFMRVDKVPGAAIAILSHGKLLYVQTYGFANLEWRAPVTRSTVFELASVTKQMTASLMAELAAEGKLSLDDTISKYIDSIPKAWEPITIRELLGHMAGLPHKFEPQTNGSFLLDYSKAFMLEAAKKAPMKSVPGTHWSYSDEGYFLAGYLAEKATGKIFDSLMKEKIFIPMKMANTRFLNQNDIIPGRAAGYVIVNGKYKNNRRQWQFELTPHFGVMSTIDDMVRYDQGIESGVIPKAVFSEVTKPYRIFFKDSVQQYAYALGWEVHDFGDRRIVTHSGYTGTVYLKDLRSGLSVIVLTNRDENQGTSQHVLAKRLARAVDPGFPDY